MEFDENHNENLKSDLFDDLGNYRDTLSISQVVKYFSRHGVDSFTKTMIQNYIRVGVLPQPEDKRRYTKKQLCMLAIIDSLKGSFSLDEIKAFFEFIDGENDSPDWYGIYLKLIDKYNAVFEDGKAEQAMDVLDLMAKSAAYKRLAILTLNRQK